MGINAHQKGNKNMLLKIAAVLVLLWVAGLIFHLLGKFINIALGVAVILIIWHFATSKKQSGTGA